MAYDKQTWADQPDTSTPITAARLSHLEDGIEAAAVVADAAAPLESPAFTGDPTVNGEVLRGLHPDTASNLTADNPVLGAYVTGYETDTGNIKIGDGTTAWNDLPYWQADTATAALALKAPLDSPAFTGTPTAPTQAAGDDSTLIATTEFVADAATVPALVTQRKIMKTLVRLVNRDTLPVNVMMIGDSIGEGYNADDILKRAQHVFYKDLVANYPTPGVTPNTDAPHILPVYYQTSVPQPSFGAVITGTPTASDSECGAGFRSYGLGATDSVLWTDVPARNLWLHYPRGDALHKQIKVTVTPHGGSPTVTTYAGESSDDNPAYGRVQIYAGTYDTLVTVKVENNAGSGTAWVSALERYSGGDSTLGIRLYDFCHGGITASKVADATHSNVLSLACTQLRPHVVVIELGVNDLPTDSAATFGANLATIIAAVRAGTAAASPPLTDPLIVLVGMYEVVGKETGSAAWAEYLAQMRQIAAGDSQVVFLDLSAFFPPNEGTGGTDEGAVSGLYFADATHLTAGGQQIFGHFMARLFSVFPNTAPTLPVTGGTVTPSRILAGGGVPTVVAAAGAGTAPPAPTVTGTDVAMSIAFGTGTSPGTGAVVTVTFAKPYTTEPQVMLTKNGNFGGSMYVSAKSTAGFSVAVSSALAASQSVGTYNVDVLVTGGT